MTHTSNMKTYSLICFVPVADIFPNPPSPSNLIYKLEREGPNEEAEELAIFKTISLLRKLKIRVKDIDSLGMEPIYIKLVYDQSDRNYLPLIMFQFNILITGKSTLIATIKKLCDHYYSK